MLCREQTNRHLLRARKKKRYLVQLAVIAACSLWSRKSGGAEHPDMHEPSLDWH
jgi:hypothetical protein